MGIFDFNTDGFKVPKIHKTEIGGNSPFKMESRYLKPAKHRTTPESKVKYKNAQDLAADMICEPNMWYLCLVDGSFIAGDFIEAFIKQHNLKANKVSISTLSLNQDNVDSLGNLLIDGWCDNLDLIVSDGFWANYQKDIVPYIYKELDFDGANFQLAVARVHTKVILIKTECGLKISIRGSANLRSSGSIEHMEVQEGDEIFDFFEKFHDSIIEAFQTINKGVKSVQQTKKLKKSETWQAVI